MGAVSLRPLGSRQPLSPQAIVHTSPFVRGGSGDDALRIGFRDRRPPGPTQRVPSFGPTAAARDTLPAHTGSECPDHVFGSQARQARRGLAPSGRAFELEPVHLVTLCRVVKAHGGGLDLQVLPRLPAGRLSHEPAPDAVVCTMSLARRGPDDHVRGLRQRGGHPRRLGARARFKLCVRPSAGR